MQEWKKLSKTERRSYRLVASPNAGWWTKFILDGKDTTIVMGSLVLLMILNLALMISSVFWNEDVTLLPLFLLISGILSLSQSFVAPRLHERCIAKHIKCGAIVALSPRILSIARSLAREQSLDVSTQEIGDILAKSPHIVSFYRGAEADLDKHADNPEMTEIIEAGIKREMLPLFEQVIEERANDMLFEKERLKMIYGDHESDVE